MGCAKNAKEVIDMPGRDGTGPLGNGAMTGRRLGRCGNRSFSYGRGMGCGRGYGRGVASMEAGGRDALEQRARFLEDELSRIKEMLNREEGA